MNDKVTIVSAIDNDTLAKLEVRAKKEGCSSVEEYISLFFDSMG